MGNTLFDRYLIVKAIISLLQLPSYNFMFLRMLKNILVFQHPLHRT